MKAYILTENDMEHLKTTMEKWELEMRLKHGETGPVSEALRHVRYHLWSWRMGVCGKEL
jgi:hypothetical protein